MSVEVEVLIVGGGIMGLNLARLYSREGWQVLCLRLPDGDAPRAETLRNQGWLQSGGRYFRMADRDLASAPDETSRQRASANRNHAVLMHYAARGVRDGFPQAVGPAAAGVLRYPPDRPPTPEQQEGRVNGALRIDEFRLDICSPETAKELAGSLFAPDGAYARTGETSFEEDRVLERLRKRALQADAQLRIVASPVVFHGPADNAWASVGEIEIRAKRIFLAAGVGLLQALQELEVQPWFSIQRTPLFVAKADVLGTARVLQDQVERLSLVQHGRGGDAACVIGFAPEGAEFPEVIPCSSFAANDHAEEERRKFDAARIAALQRALPEPLRQASIRTTAGFEILPDDDVPDWRSSLRAIAHGSNIVVANPGRATFAAELARQAFDSDVNGDWDCEQVPRGIPRPTRADLDPAGLPGSPWTEPIRMHFRSCYDHVNDVREAR